MTIVMALGRAMLGMKANMEALMGTMVYQKPGGTAWVVGFVMHMMLSILIALIYMVGFEKVTHKANALIGAAFAIPHAIIGGLVIGLLGAVHPLIPAMMPNPGPYMINMGAIYVVAMFAVHMMYGATVGAVYAPAESALHESAVPPMGARI